MLKYEKAWFVIIFSKVSLYGTVCRSDTSAGYIRPLFFRKMRAFIPCKQEIFRNIWKISKKIKVKEVCNGPEYVFIKLVVDNAVEL